MSREMQVIDLETCLRRGAFAIAKAGWDTEKIKDFARRAGMTVDALTRDMDLYRCWSALAADVRQGLMTIPKVTYGEIRDLSNLPTTYQRDVMSQVDDSLAEVLYEDFSATIKPTFGPTPAGSCSDHFTDEFTACQKRILAAIDAVNAAEEDNGGRGQYRQILSHLSSALDLSVEWRAECLT